MVSQQAARSIVGVIGNVISFGLFLSPVLTFWRIIKVKDVEGFKPDPYLATLLNCMLWVFYGIPIVHPNSTLVVTINGIGLVIEATYLTIFFLYSDSKKRKRALAILAVEIVFMVVVVVAVLLTAHTHKKRSMIVGILCVIFGTCMYASPLTVMFNGAVQSCNASFIWRAHAEGKHKFFGWLLAQAKILTADRLKERQWPCNPLCVLCDQQPETAVHLYLHCPFALEVWELLRLWIGDAGLPSSLNLQSIGEWWVMCMRNRAKERRRTIAAFLLYTSWNIWKERNRRIFEGKASTPLAVFNLTKDEMLLRKYACGHPWRE